MTKNRLGLFELAALLALAVAAARADMLLGNLPSYSNDGGPTANLPGNKEGKAIGFTTGAGGYLLSDVVLRLDVHGAANVPRVTLYSGGSTSPTVHAPTAYVETFLNPAFAYDALADYTFPLARPVPLAPNTTYWIVIESTGTATQIRIPSGSPQVSPGGADAASFAMLYSNGGAVATWTTQTTATGWFEIDGSPTLWRIGLNDGQSAEFTGSTVPSSYTIPAGWATQTTWTNWPSANVNSAWTTDIHYTLGSVPAGGALFTFQAADAKQLMPQLAVYSNGSPCGILQICGDAATTGTYSHNRLFRQPYQVYVPKEFLQAGANTLHLARLGHPYNATAGNVYDTDFVLDYLELDGLPAVPFDPIHGKYTHVGVAEGALTFTDDGVANAAQALLEWAGVAYCGGPERVGFFKGEALTPANQLDYLDKLRDLDMTVILDGLSGRNSTGGEVAGGSLPAADQAYLDGLFASYGALVQFYELTNEPCQPFSNVSYDYITVAAEYVNSIKPGNVRLAAPGYAFGGGSGTPVNWDNGSNDDLRQALDDLCDAYGGHAFGVPGWGIDGGSLAETIDADGTYVAGEPEFTGGFDKPFVCTECGGIDTAWENIAQITTTRPYSESLDTNLRAVSAYADYMCFADAFHNPGYNLFDGDYATPSSWVAHPNGGYLPLTVAAAAGAGATSLGVVNGSIVHAGAQLSGAGLASGTTAAAVSGNTVSLSAALTAAVPAGETVSVVTRGQPLEAGQVTGTAAAAASAGATTVSVTNASGLFGAGSVILGTGFASTTTVTAVSGTTVTLSKALIGNVANGEKITAYNVAASQPSVSRLQILRRIALAYGTHGKPLPFVYNGIPSGTYPLVYFRGVDASALPPLPGSGAASTKLLLSFVNFDPLHGSTISVTVTMPHAKTYAGVCYGAGDTLAAAKSTVSLATDAGGRLTFSLALAPGESTEYILDP